MQRDDHEIAEQLVKDDLGPALYSIATVSSQGDLNFAIAWCKHGLRHGRQLYAEQVEQAAQSLPLKERNEFFTALRKVQGRAP